VRRRFPLYLTHRSLSLQESNLMLVYMQIIGVAHLLVSLGILLAMDKFLKQAFVAASIKFPSALFGMFCVFSVLVVFDTFVPPLAKAFIGFFEPATLFIQRWLSLFYVPTLVVLPLAVGDIPAASGIKILAITCMNESFSSRTYIYAVGIFCASCYV
jgi:hypothetical protein